LDLQTHSQGLVVKLGLELANRREYLVVNTCKGREIAEETCLERILVINSSKKSRRILLMLT